MSIRNHGLAPNLKDVAVYDKGCGTFNLTAETEFSDLNSNFAFLKARKGRILEVMFRKSGLK
ncbi:hypothetical protein [Microcoleus sp. herbarium14]|uniref:hypothetical protein n=1 Tax=Microcoleus sp. herbarium14 TaxID=3055439 RepID=UPI002FD18BA5